MAGGFANEPATATVFAPASVGNVGPGFDVLGLAVDGLGDTVRVDLYEGPTVVEDVTGADAALVPREAGANAAAVAAVEALRLCGERRGARVRLHKGVPLASGLGGSAASSVAGALAAWHAAGREARVDRIVAAALAGEAVAAGRHLDNVAACVLGGLALVRCADPIDVLRVPLGLSLWVALITPPVHVETRAARALLPDPWERAGWVPQMANTAALVYALASGDRGLIRRALDDGYAEPRRAALIPYFNEMKAAALGAGALGASISGAGPTVFALAGNLEEGESCLATMRGVLGMAPRQACVARVAERGARVV